VIKKKNDLITNDRNYLMFPNDLLRFLLVNSSNSSVNSFFFSSYKNRTAKRFEFVKHPLHILNLQELDHKSTSQGYRFSAFQFFLFAFHQDDGVIIFLKFFLTPGEQQLAESRCFLLIGRRYYLLSR